MRAKIIKEITKVIDNSQIKHEQCQPICWQLMAAGAAAVPQVTSRCSGAISRLAICCCAGSKMQPAIREKDVSCCCMALHRLSKEHVQPASMQLEVTGAMPAACAQVELWINCTR